jgi:isocitrate lyase
MFLKYIVADMITGYGVAEAVRNFMQFMVVM